MLWFWEYAIVDILDELCYIVVMLGELYVDIHVIWCVKWLAHPYMFLVVVSTYDDQLVLYWMDVDADIIGEA